MDGSKVGKNRARINVRDLPLLLAQRVALIRKNELSNQDFLYYLIRTNRFEEFVTRIQTGSSVPHISQRQIEEYIVPLIPVHEQKKISQILLSLDSKIELNNRINVELEAIAKTLYDYWFLQYDFPNSEGTPYKSSGGKMIWKEELKREVPEGWQAGLASELFDFNPTLSLKKNSLASYIDMDALPTKGFMTKGIERKKFNGGVKFQNGDLIVARITPCLENGKTGLITLLTDNETGFGSTEFIVLRGKRRSLSCFAAFLSRSESFRKFAITNMTGTSGRKRVDSETLKRFSLAIPDTLVLERFEKVVTPFFQKQTVNTKENKKLSELRDWLLPMLMNGQVRVKEIKK